MRTWGAERLRPRARFRPVPVEVVTEQAPVYPRLLTDLMPAARHVTERYANNSIEADHGRLKAKGRGDARTQRQRLRAPSPPGYAFGENPRRGHYAITGDLQVQDRARVAFDELALVL